MFDQLFRMPHVLARLENGPLAEDRRRYLSHCAEQRMAPQTLGDIARFTLRIVEALRLAERRVKSSLEARSRPRRNAGSIGYPSPAGSGTADVCGFGSRAMPFGG